MDGLHYRIAISQGEKWLITEEPIHAESVGASCDGCDVSMDISSWMPQILKAITP